MIGNDWKKFIEDLFTVDLPEECRYEWTFIHTRISTPWKKRSLPKNLIQVGVCRNFLCLNLYLMFKQGTGTRRNHRVHWKVGWWKSEQHLFLCLETFSFLEEDVAGITGSKCKLGKKIPEKKHLINSIFYYWKVKSHFRNIDIKQSKKSDQPNRKVLLYCFHEN